MRVLKAVCENTETASRIIRSGGLVIYPTDTFYGLGCDPFNVKAVNRLILVKGRKGKPLPILAANIEDVRRVALITARAERVGEYYWPGALTLVLPRKGLSDASTFDFETVGMRIPDHEFARRLIKLSGGLLVGTSANKSGAPSPSRIDEIDPRLKEDVDLVLDGGPSKLGVSSTVIDMTTEPPQVLRKGAISQEDITRFLDRHLDTNR